MAVSTYRLEDFARDPAADPPDFDVRYAPGFLVYAGTRLGTDEDAPSTSVIKADVRAILDAPEGSAKSTYVAASLVFPVQRTGRAATIAFITLGRTQNNDLVLPDHSISSFHAMFHDRRDGELRLQDGGSRNGTFVDGTPAPGRDAPEGIVLRSGVVVRFGSVELTYLDSKAFHLVVSEVVAP